MADDRQDELAQEIVDLAQEDVEGGGKAHIVRWYMVSEVEVIGTDGGERDGARLMHSRSDNVAPWHADGLADAIKRLVAEDSHYD